MFSRLFQVMGKVELPPIPARMTRLCFPEGLMWPVDREGRRMLPDLQAEVSSTKIIILRPCVSASLEERLAALLNVPATTPRRELEQLLVERDHLVRVTQWTEVIVATGRGEETGLELRGDCYNYYPTKGGKDPVILGAVRAPGVHGVQLGQRWTPRFSPPVRGHDIGLDDRFAVANLDLTKLS